MRERIVLVDPLDRPAGVMEKMEVHRRGLLHRAVSVLVFNSSGECLLQKRSAFKYHSADLWSNTCCTHPFPDELPITAARRRLTEEMGLRCSLDPLFCFTYQERLSRELTEHEYDHVFIGHTDELPVINTTEVSDWCYLPLDLVYRDGQAHPEKYTIWFRHIVRELLTSNYSL